MHDLARASAHVRTPDERLLRVECPGDPAGRPVFLLHGMPGSRVGPRPRPMFLYQRGTRLISYDRPGYGGSDRRPGRRVVDAVEDVTAVADALGVERFAVGLDWYAGMAPSNVRDFSTALTDPQGFTERLIPRSAAIRSDPARLLEDLREDLTDDDRLIVSDNGIRSMLLRNYHEAVRTPPYGWLDDAPALTSPWGFDPGGIRVPVLFWYGAKDVFSPAAHSSWLAERIPRATAVLEPAAAHFASLRALPAVLGWLLKGTLLPLTPLV